ncbi:MAG: serine/threonine protein kinase [Myxococcales bacterium]|nr:serine/threonine protein kinase [Myxococcales bacterium]
MGESSSAPNERDPLITVANPGRARRPELESADTEHAAPPELDGARDEPPLAGSASAGVEARTSTRALLRRSTLEASSLPEPPGELARAPSSPSLETLGRVGRFALLRQLGAGGMGVVYSAFDEVLERRVAIKLVRADRGGTSWQARILREAQALARLSHPNVVQVYDAGEHGGQIYVAMEYVKGETLSAWLARHAGGRPQRAARPILELFTQAGRGLAAAHAEGLVHRDFKPDNVLVGEDGRVRVVDFGLVVARGPAREELAVTAADELSGARLSSSIGSALGVELTRDGAVMGTPAYMSPEQFLGLAVDARSDQFSFCVALYEALHGARPFRGERHSELMANVTRGVRDKSVREHRAVRPRIRAAIERGLATDPAARWPSMDALLELLSDRAGRRRRRVYAAVAVLAVATGAGLGYSAYEARARARCEALGGAATDAWDDAAQQRVERAFAATGVAHAAATWERTRDAMTEWALGWSAARTQACMDARADRVLAARGALCLDRQLPRFTSLVEAYEQAGRGVVDQAVRTATSLPPTAMCESPQWLLAGPEARGEADAGDAAEQTRARMAKARSLSFLGDYEPALEIAEESVTEASAQGDDYLRSEALLLRADVTRMTGDYERARDDAKAAYYLAGRLGHDRVALDAALALLSVLGYFMLDVEGVDVWAPAAEMLLARLELEDSVFSGKFHIAYGAALRRQGRHHEAMEQYERALATLERTMGARDPAVAQVLSNIGATLSSLGRDDEGLVYLRRGLVLAEQRLGPRHPDISVMLNNIGVVLEHQGMPEQALEAAQRALSIDEEVHGAKHPTIGVSLINLGAVCERLERLDEAEAHYARAQRVFEATLGPESPYVGYAIGSRGDVEYKRGAFKEARALYERALELIPDAPEHAMALANVRFKLARVLTTSGEELERARALVQQMREYLDRAEGKDPTLQQEYEEWVARQAELGAAPP